MDDDVTELHTDGQDTGNADFDLAGPWGRIGAGVAVFVIASIVQGIGGSHMFTMEFQEPDSFVLELLVQATWWPGWVLTVVLIGMGLFGLLDRD